MRIVAISDVHGKWNKLTIPECDVLISAGDYSFKGEKHMVKDFHEWLNKQDAGYIISVQGNHELWVEKNFEEAKAIAEVACTGVHFIGSGQAVEIEGIKFYGSAITPWFYDWAWNVKRGPDIIKEWAKIPDDTNVLITHSPAYGILDIVPYFDGTPKERVGCHDLMNRINNLKQLKVHISGHIHHSYGHKYFNGIQFYNVSICDEQYIASNPITIIDI